MGKSNRWLIIIIPTVVAGIIYSRTLSQAIFAGDSGDLASAALVRGIAHPSGYPLYLLIAQIPLLVPIGTVAAKVGLISLVAGAVASGITALIIFRLTSKILPSLLAGFLLAFLHPFWLYSSVAEVFTLNVFFAAILTLIAIYITIFKKSQIKLRKLWFLLAFLVGLSLAHHHTIILIFPGLFYLLYSSFKAAKFNLKDKLLLITSFILGLSPYLYVPIAASFYPPINWGDPSTLNGFIRLVTRADYGTFQAVRGVFGNAQQNLLQLVWYFKLYLTDFTIVGTLLSIIGIVSMFIKNHRIAISCFAAYILSGPFFLFYANFSLDSPFQLGVTERFVLVSYFFGAIFVGLGVANISDFIEQSRKLKILAFKLRPLVIVTIWELSIFLFPLFLIINNFPKANLKNIYLGDTLAHDVLTTPTTDSSVILLQDDTVVFNTIYYYHAYDYRPNIKLLSGSVRTSNHRQELRHRLPQLNIPNEEESKDISPVAIYTEILKRNMDSYEFYSYAGGPDIEGYEWIPYGILFKLIKKDLLTATDYQEQLKEVWQKYSFNVKNDTNIYHNFFFDHIFGVYKNGYYNTGINLFNRQQYLLAENYLRKSLEVDKNYDLAKIWLGVTLSRQNKCESAQEYLTSISAENEKYIDSLIHLKLVYEDCFGNLDKAQEIQNKIENVQKTKDDLPLQEF